MNVSISAEVRGLQQQQAGEQGQFKYAVGEKMN